MYESTDEIIAAVKGTAVFVINQLLENEPGESRLDAIRGVMMFYDELKKTFEGGKKGGEKQ